MLEALPIECLLIPLQIGEQILQVLLRRAGLDLRARGAVLVRMLGQQAGQITFETGKTPIKSERETERREKFGQFRQRLTRYLWQSFVLFHATILLISSP